MSGYAIVNLKEIEDSAGERAPGIEARFARTFLDSAHLGIGQTSSWVYTINRNGSRLRRVA